MFDSLTAPASTMPEPGSAQLGEQLSVHGFARSVNLTPAATRVLELLCSGVRPTAIARQQNVAVSTVRTQIGSIRAKTGAGNISELVRQVAVLPPLVGALRGAIVMGARQHPVATASAPGALFRARRGTQFITEGDHGDTSFIVLEGRLKACSVDADDREVRYAEYGPGDYIGEMSLDDGPRAATVGLREIALNDVYGRLKRRIDDAAMPADGAPAGGRAAVARHAGGIDRLHALDGQPRAEGPRARRLAGRGARLPLFGR